VTVLQQPQRSIAALRPGLLVIVLPLAAALLGSGLFAGESPLRWKPGPYLLLDDALVARSENLARRVRPPARLPGPVVTGALPDGTGDNCFQPYLTVLYYPPRSPRGDGSDAGTGRFRLWYGIPTETLATHVATMESEDGIRWIRPHRVLEDPAQITFGTAVVDRGPGCPRPEERFALGFWGSHQGKSGLQIAVSPDGLGWKILDVVVPSNHDICWLGWDPIRGRYLAFVSNYLKGEWGGGPRRIPYAAVSPDLRNWTEPRRVVKPEPGEKGETEFYCMAGAIARGDLLVALVKVLRDDLNAEPEASAKDMGDRDRPFAGIGYTVLAWSQDGETWARDIEPFLDRSPTPGAWDRAMAWGDCQTPVGEEVFVYYGGYRRGHKVERTTERQIGLAWMGRDRYVARAAEGGAAGRLRTKSGVLDAAGLTVNARMAPGGRLTVRLLDADGRVPEGFGPVELRGDSTALPVRWGKGLSGLRGAPVALEFEVSGGEIYSFDWLEI
jgi:hypothetical protein